MCCSTARLAYQWGIRTRLNKALNGNATSLLSDQRVGRECLARDTIQ